MSGALDINQFFQPKSDVKNDSSDDFVSQFFPKPKKQNPYRVIATTEDGEVYEMADGQRGFRSPGMSTTDPDTVARILEGATPSEEYQRGILEDVVDQAPLGARATSLVRGVPFVGSRIDELAGAIGGEEANRNVDLMARAMQETRPIQNAAIGAAGSIAATAPAVMSAAPAVIGKGVSLGGQILRGAALGSAAGATEGAIYASGDAEDGERAGAAAQGGVIGAGTGAAFGAAAPVVRQQFGRFLDFMRGSDAGKIAKELGVSEPAAKAIRDALSADAPGDIASRLSAAGDGAMLADAGPATAGLLDVAAQSGGDALARTSRAVDTRTRKAVSQMDKALDRALGPSVGVQQQAREISSRTAPARRAAYGKAYEQPINYAADSGRRIEQVLERIPSRTLQAAINEANEDMQAQGLKNLQILADIAEDGAVSFREMPNVQQLDEIKKALGKVAEDNKDQFGRLLRPGQRAQNLARDLRDAISEAVPEYRNALRLGGDKIAEDSALSIGASMLRPSVSREMVADALRRASPAERRSAKQGLRRALDDITARVKPALSASDTEIQEGARLFKELMSREARENVGVLLGDKAASVLYRDLEKASVAFQLRSAVAANSRTAGRIAGKEAIDAASRPGFLSQLARTGPLEINKPIVEALSGTSEEAIKAREADIYAEIAEVLTRSEGVKARQALRMVERAKQNERISADRAQFIADAVAVTFASSQQQLQRRLEGQLQ